MVYARKNNAFKMKPEQKQETRVWHEMEIKREENVLQCHATQLLHLPLEVGGDEWLVKNVPLNLINAAEDPVAQIFTSLQSLHTRQNVVAVNVSSSAWHVILFINEDIKPNVLLLRFKQKMLTTLMSMSCVESRVASTFPLWFLTRTTQTHMHAEVTRR